MYFSFVLGLNGVIPLGIAEGLANFTFMIIIPKVILGLMLFLFRIHLITTTASPIDYKKYPEIIVDGQIMLFPLGDKSSRFVGKVLAEKVSQ